MHIHTFTSNKRSEPMTIKVGNIVSHSGGLDWGVGKVLEVTAAMATIHFSDGKNRKIASSHFSSLQPAVAEYYIPPSEAAPAAKAPRASKAVKKKV
jgi:transcription elongation factor GreA-like protein